MYRDFEQAKLPRDERAAATCLPKGGARKSMRATCAFYRKRCNHARYQDPDVDAVADNFDEVALGYTEEQAVDEADRCLNCKT